MSKKKRRKTKRRLAAAYAEGMQRAMAQGNMQQGMGAGLRRLLPSGRNEQFLVGALVGAAAAYLLGDEEMRGKLMKQGIKLYSSLMGSFEEMKEQMADMQAEVEAEREGAA